MRNCRYTIWAGLLLVTAAFIPNAGAEDFSFDYQKILNIGADAQLTLSFVSGDVSVVQSEDDRLVIDARKRVNAATLDEAQLVADHIEIRVAKDDKKVGVTANYLRLKNNSRTFWSKVLGKGGDDAYGNVDWDIKIPVGGKVTIINTGGKIKIDHIVGDVDVRSSASEIELLSIEGSVKVENLSGFTTGELLFGTVDVRQTFGRIDLKFVEGDIRIKSSTAGISIRQDEGALDLTTQSGDVDIQTNLNSARDCFVATESGHIRLMIPETSSGDLRIESQTGDIKTDMPITIKSMSRKQVEGTFGFGGVKINLTSVSGDVTVAQF